MSQVTFLDRMVAWAAPEADVRRALARRSFEALATKTRGYDGAAKGRRTDGWKAAGTSADAEIVAASGLLRDRMRDLTRNNPHAAKAVSVLVNNIVGSGIIPRAATADAKLDETVDRLWTEWTAACDADGQLDIFGLQTLAVREMIEAGEVLIRRRPRRPSDGLSVPLQVQIIEADLLDNTRNGDLADGGRLLQGIEFDPLGCKSQDLIC
jgi:lambda family phage portal protein